MPRHSYSFSLGGLPRGRIKTLLVGWVVAEFIALVLAIKLLGFGGTILLTFASSVLGLVLLRRLGLDATRHVRNAVVGGMARDGALLDGTVAAFGALLLIVPGFVTDIVGLALAAPSIRQVVLARLGASVSPAAPVRRNAAPDVIDLTPADWSVVETPRKP